MFLQRNCPWVSEITHKLASQFYCSIIMIHFRKSVRIILLLSSFFPGALIVSSQPLGNRKYVNFIADDAIKTAKVIVLGNELAYPAIALQGDALLELSFDALGNVSRDFMYQLIHCNADWSASELFSDEFMEGFNENRIYDYDFSINTKIPYVHYRVELPNQEVQFKASGNYIFRVIEAGNRDSTLLTLRFAVYEPLVSINAEVIRPASVAYKDNSQEISLNIRHDDLVINDPFNEVKITISQNNRPDRMLSGMKPVFVRDNELVYNFSGEHIFSGGNEFYTLNFSNVPKLGLNINDVQYVDSVYHVQARLNERRSYKKYFWEEDMNGKFIVNKAESDDSWLSADYVYVHFALEMTEPFLTGSVFTYGAFNHWQCNALNKMEYNFDKHWYELALLMKQGYYNYTYVYLDSFTSQLDEVILEGSHYQTENDYLISVYYRDFDNKFDRLVGYKVINSKYTGE